MKLVLKIFLLLNFLFCANLSYADNNYFSYNGRKIGSKDDCIEFIRNNDFMKDEKCKAYLSTLSNYDVENWFNYACNSFNGSGPDDYFCIRYARTSIPKYKKFLELYCDEKDPGRFRSEASSACKELGYIYEAQQEYCKAKKYFEKSKDFGGDTDYNIEKMEGILKHNKKFLDYLNPTCY